MAVYQRRTRIVSFRLSEEEYQALYAFSQGNGARSVSDCARDLACKGIEGDPRGDDSVLTAQVQNLRGTVGNLRSELERLMQMAVNKHGGTDLAGYS